MNNNFNENINNQNGGYNFQTKETINQNNNYTVDVNNNNKSNKKKIVILSAVVLLIVGAIVIFFILNKKNSSGTNNIDAFFLSNNDKYALFSSSGKQLTDFIYTSVDDFDKNGIAVVKKDDSYGMINTNGKVTVDFGKYKYVNRTTTLYKVIDTDNHSYLITGKGKVLYDLDKYDTKTVNNVVFVYDDKNIMALNYQGDVILKKSIVMGENFSATLYSRYKGNEWVAMIHYDNNNILYNMTTGKQMLSINDSHPYYVYAPTVRSDNLLIYKYLSDSPNTSNSNEPKQYKMIIDGKTKDIDNKCVNIFSASEKPTDTSRGGAIIEYNRLACADKDGNKYWFDENFKPVANNIKSGTIFYKDYNNYVVSSNNKVEFYKNGKLVNTISGKYIYDISGFKYSKLDLIELFDAKKYHTREFYDSEGNKVFDKSFEDIKYYDGDKTSFVAVVSEDRDNYYLIDENGNKISEDYDEISEREGYFIAKKGNKWGLIDKKGKIIIPVDKNYIRMEYSYTEEFAYALYTSLDGTSTYYRLDTGATITVKSDDLMDMNSKGFIEADTNKGKEYYTLDGKKIYETTN